MVISSQAIRCSALIERFPQLFLDHLGDLERQVNNVRSPENATPQSILFLANTKALAVGIESTAEVLVVNAKLREAVEAERGKRTVLIAKNVELAMASVIREFFLATPYTNRSIAGVHPAAHVSPEAQIAAGCRVGPGAYIGANVKLAAGVYVGSGSVIEDQSEIGAGTVIHPLVFIGHSTIIGERCEVHPQSAIGKEGYGYAHDEKGRHYRIPHQGRVVLEDDVHIGACCTIDRATFGETRIGAGTKFDNQIHIAHNCKIGRNALITAGFTMAGSSKIGDGFIAGGNSVVTGHIEVGDNVHLAAFSGVSKTLMQAGQYGGLPLVPLQQHIRIKAAQVHLPQMRKQIRMIMNKLGLTDSSSQTDS